jgi:PAP2 superfamily
MEAAGPEAGDGRVATLVDGERGPEERQADQHGGHGEAGHGQAEAVDPRAAWTRHRLLYLILGYLAGLGAMIFFKGLYLTPDRYFLILLVPALALGVARRYVLDFLPFIVLMIVYEELRGVAHIISPHPYYAPQLDLDKLLFGGAIPTIWLQQHLWDGHLSWWEALLSLLIRLHFIVPPTLLFLVWLRNRTLYYRLVGTLLAVSYIGVIGFTLWPAAPPWMAARDGWIPQLTRIDNVSAGQATQVVASSHSWIDQQILRNEAAAVPSLHAAYALLVVLFCVAWFGRRGWLVLPYAAFMWFAIVYFGEHYVSDAILGVALAVAVYVAVGRLFRREPFSRVYPPPLASARGRPVKVR